MRCAQTMWLVIASEAKQSSLRRRPGLLRRFAPRNDENGEQDARVAQKTPFTEAVPGPVQRGAQGNAGALLRGARTVAFMQEAALPAASALRRRAGTLPAACVLHPDRGPAGRIASASHCRRPAPHSAGDAFGIATAALSVLERVVSRFPRRPECHQICLARNVSNSSRQTLLKSCSKLIDWSLTISRSS